MSKLLVVAIAVITILTGCASRSDYISSMVSTADGIPHQNHYQYRGPYQFAIASQGK